MTYTVTPIAVQIVEGTPTFNETLTVTCDGENTGTATVIEVTTDATSIDLKYTKKDNTATVTGSVIKKSLAEFSRTYSYVTDDNQRGVVTSISQVPSNASIYRYTAPNPMGNVVPANIKIECTSGTGGTSTSAWACGVDTYGALGFNGESKTTLTSLGAYSKINQGYGLTALIKPNGTLWTCGYNYFGGLGLGDNINRSSPTQVGNLSTWKEVSCAYNRLFAIKTDGSLWGCGDNLNQILGFGDDIHRSIPTQVGTLRTWKTVNCQTSKTLATDTLNRAWLWGYDGYGEFGLGESGKVFSTPTLLDEYSIAFTPLLTVYGWNSSGKFGDPQTFFLLPKTLDYADSDWINSYIKNTMYHMAIVKGNGTLWATGNILYDQYLYTTASSPVQIGSLSDWSKVSVGEAYTMALKMDGTLWTWGNAAEGRLGVGDDSPRYSPTQVGVSSDWDSVSCGLWHTAAITINGVMWAWGTQASYALGNGNSYGYQPSPIEITQEYDSSLAVVPTTNNWNQVSCGSNYTLAIKTTGTLWGCGYNNSGQLGLSSYNNSPYFRQVGTLSNWSKVDTANNSRFSTLAVKTNGTLWAWGRNDYGQLGLGDTLPRISPVQVGTNTNWSDVSFVEYYTLALNNQGGLFQCGYWNNNYVVTLTEVEPNSTWSNFYVKNTPIKTHITDIYWKDTDISLENFIGIKEDGTLWACGYYAVELMGFPGEYGAPTSTSSLVQIGMDTDWKTCSVNFGTAAVIKTDGTLWTCGYNYFGGLGLGDNINRSSPTQVGNLSTWKEVSCGYKSFIALKTDGTIWTCGYNNYNLGFDDALHRSSPCQVGTLSTWSDITITENAIGAIQGIAGTGTTNIVNIPFNFNIQSDWNKANSELITAVKGRTV